RSAEEDFVQLIADDERWRQVAAAAAPVVHEDVISVRRGIPGSKEYVGLDGFRALWLDWLAPWAEYRTAIEEAIDCGEHVLLLQSPRSGAAAGQGRPANPSTGLRGALLRRSGRS